MSDGTQIEWADATWQIVTGCSIASAGCKNCYAMKLAGGRLRHHPSRIGLIQVGAAGPVWTGEVRFNAQCLDQPLGWKRGRNIFPCAHGDLFHENVPFEWIDKVFSVMLLTPQHTYQVLTKRADRMRAYVEDLVAGRRWIFNSEQVRRAMADPDVGGESGAGARPMHTAWATAIRDACKGAGVAFFFKQWGAWAPATTHEQLRFLGDLMRAGKALHVYGDDREPDGRFREGDEHLLRVTKKEAGRLLDGKLYEAYPG